MRAATALAAAALAWLPGCAAPGAAAAWKEVPAAPEAWVDMQLAPALAGRLREHPRFAGATLAVGLPPELRPGDGHGYSRLEQRLEAVLESRLLHAGGLRLRAGDGSPCETDAADYALGLVVGAVGGESRVELRVVERATGEWVTGLADSWQGLLSRGDLADQAAPARPVRDRGSREAPYAAGEPERVTEALAAELSCRLAAARLRPGPVRAGADPLAPLAAGYLAALGHPRSDDGPWSLTIRREPEAPGVEAAIATLASDDGAVTARRYLRVAAGPAVPARVSRPAPARIPVPAPGPAKPVLGRADCGPGCLGVWLDDPEDTVLLAVLPGTGLAGTRGCDVRIDAAGRLQVELPAGPRAWTSVYAVRAHGPAARRLARLEARLPSACHPRGRTAAGLGLGEIEDIATEAGPALAWTRLVAHATGDPSP